MKLFEKRPLALFCTVILATCALFANAGLVLKASVACAALAFSVAAFLLWRFGDKVRLLWGVCLAAVCLSLGSSMLSIDRRDQLAESFVYEEPVTMSGIVVDKEGENTFSVRVTEIDGKDCRLKMRLYEYDLPLFIGDTLTFTGKVNADYQKRSDGIFAQLDEVDGLAVVSHKNTFKARLFSLKSLLVTSMQNALGEHSGGLFLALLVGDTSLLDNGLSLSFRRLGLSHMLAVSGLHVSVLCGALAYFCRKILHMSKRRYLCVSLSFVVFYCLFTGASAGVIRATVMSVTAILAFAVASSNDSMTSLFTAAASIMLFSPTSVYDVGFWLSVTATLGVLVALRLLEKWRLPKRRWLASLVSASTLTVCATLTTLPLSIFYFGEYSMLCLPANLAFGFLLQICLICALLLAFFSFIPYFGAVFGKCVLYLEVFVCRCVNACADLKGVVAELSFVQTKVLWCLFAVALFLFLCLDRKRHRWLTPMLSVAFVCAIAVSAVCHVYSQKKHEIIYESIDGTDIFLYSENGAHHLILSASGSLGAMFDARNILEMHHVSELETLVLTHWHNGHGRYLSTFFEGVKVHTLMLPDSYDVFEFEDLANITLEAKRHGVSVLFYEANDILTFGEMTVSFLPIAKPPFESRHDGF
ncbi:MAG: ComEC/Rec2 family competence protein, partial [Clostridia bacterium]|nr:ComEC/Rec2 family competence protein [Clostridia bacterium]